MGMASILGLTDENTKGNGRKTTCTVKVYIHGVTVVSIKVVITMTRNKVMEYILGLMVANTMVNG